MSTVKETSRQRWVRVTRESTARAMKVFGVAVTAGVLEGNLDCAQYLPSLGFTGVRSEREIGAALRWLAAQGYAKRCIERYPEDPPGVLYELTPEGRAFAEAVR